MMRSALVAGLLLLAGSATPAFAADALPRDEVAVVFKEPPGERFVAVLNLVMGTETIKRATPQRYVFHIGERGNQNDYALFFSTLPYVKSVTPLPRLSAGEREMPNVGLAYSGEALAAQGFVPDELVVRFKAGVSTGAVDAFNRAQGVSLKDSIDGIDARVFTLPQGLTVPEAAQRYRASGLVEYAEPNRLYSLPAQPSGPAQGAAPSASAAPGENAGGPGIFLSPGQLIGTHVLVRYRAGGPVPALINQIYGTHTLEETEADQARLALPPKVSPLVAQRVLRLCPYISQAEPAYGR